MGSSHASCKGLCERIRTSKKPNYDKGDKYCRQCESSYRNHIGFICPCCKNKVAACTHRKRQRLLQRHKKYLMPNDIDFKTMSLPELMIKYPRVRDKY